MSEMTRRDAIRLAAAGVALSVGSTKAEARDEPNKDAPMKGQSIKTVGFVLFDGVERLDYEGPLAVLAWTSREAGAALEFRLLSKDGKAIRDHLLKRSIKVDGATSDFKRFDLLIVPGGNLKVFGGDGDLVKEVGRLGVDSAVVASVCTGAFLVAKTGMADGKSMTTHHAFKQQFRQDFPKITVPGKARFVRDGALWSSAGISAGIDMSLQLVNAVWGARVAKNVQQASLEYCPEPPFPC